MKRVRDLPGAVNDAFAIAQEGVPGPVFVECPIDLLYDESLVREWFATSAPAGKKQPMSDRALSWYLNRHVKRLFAGAGRIELPAVETIEPPLASAAGIRTLANRVRKAQRPLLLIGSQALLDAPSGPQLAAAVNRLGVPAYLSGMARGLLGPSNPLQIRNQRRAASQT